MSKIVKNATDELRVLIIKALEKAMENGDIPEAQIPSFGIEIPANRDNGDYSSNIAFVCAKAFRCAPKRLQTLLQAISTLTVHISTAVRLQAQAL